MQRHLILTSLIFLTACKDTEPSAESQKTSKSVELSKPDELAEAPRPWASRSSEHSGFPCDVEAVLAESCRRCHWTPTENDAPFSLKTWEDTQSLRSGKQIAVLMKQMVEADLMPPLDALVTPDVEPLSPRQKGILLDWLGRGAPKSDNNCSH